MSAEKLDYKFGPSMAEAAEKRLRERGWDTCVRCGKDITLVADGTLRFHGPANRRCAGSRSYGLLTSRDAALGGSVGGQE